MRTNLSDLKKFYETNLGQMACSIIQKQIRSLWPCLNNQNLLGLGYTLPYLSKFSDEASQIISAIPGSQKEIKWHDDKLNLTTIIEELAFPFCDLSISKILIIHAAEYSAQINPFLREIWRILDNNGKLIIVIPNRRGIWARFEHTPFGQGRPYSFEQLNTLLQNNMFNPINTRWAICAPPVNSKFVLSTATSLEKISSGIFSHFAGIIIVEAEKKIYAGTPLTITKHSQPIFVLPQ